MRDSGIDAEGCSSRDRADDRRQQNEADIVLVDDAAVNSVHARPQGDQLCGRERASRYAGVITRERLFSLYPRADCPTCTFSPLSPWLDMEHFHLA
jgi:hypothetical protein